MAQNEESILDQSVATPPIFDGVFFAIVPKTIREDKATQLIADLTTHGAQQCPLDSADLRHITHLISSTADFPAYHDAVDGYIHVIKPSWVEHSLQKGKTPNPRQYSPDPSLFLSDVTITFAGDIPEGDKDAIVGGVYAMGGQYSPHLTKLCTHIVALTLDNHACQILEERKLRVKPVLPHWFDACLRLGKRINHQPYLLPDPPILAIDGGKPIRFMSSAIDGASHRDPPELTEIPAPPESPSKVRKQLSVFRTKKVMLHNDLGLSKRLEKILCDLIVKSDGSLVSAVEEADMLICQYRENADWRKAGEIGIDVGNLSWLYWLINHNKWTDPTRRLLHYPFPKHGISGFKNFKIALSNYTGDARIYMESLIKAAGGTYTKTMSQENTHLVTAHLASEKSEAATEWGIHMINHLWLEESYAKCQLQTVTQPRYVTFPEQTNLCEVVGQTQIDRQALQRIYFPVSPTNGLDREDRDVDVTVGPTPTTERPKTDSKRKSLQTPLPSRLRSDDIETPGSRGAKDRALNKLHAMAPDIALYQKEAKRVGGVVYGGRRVSDEDRIALEAPNGRKRSSSAAEIFVAEDKASEIVAPDKEIQPQKKRAKKAQPETPGTSEPQMTVLVTGYDKDGSNNTSTLKKKLRGLNITILDDVSNGKVDVIAAPRIMRTRKFLVGMAAGPAIVNVKWLEDMVERKSRLPLDEYTLKEDAQDMENHIDLSKAISRARTHKAANGMLKNWTIFCTEGTKGGFLTFDEIIKANGGRCLLFKGRETIVHRSRDKENIADNWEMVDGAENSTMDGREEQGTDGIFRGPSLDDLCLISDVKDKLLWPKFETMAREQGYVPKVVKPDWILRIAQTQDLGDWQQEWLMSH